MFCIPLTLKNQSTTTTVDFDPYSNASQLLATSVDGAAVFDHIRFVQNESDGYNASAAIPSEMRPLPMTMSELVEDVIYTKIILAVCAFGIVGNLLNLVILSQKSLTYTMERMEKSAHYGLIGLAVSDMLVCAATLPKSYQGTRVFDSYDAVDFRLLYIVYGDGVINTFILSSTWLTITMAVSRYLAICYPLQARQFIGKTFAVTSLVVVFVVCSAFNIPRYFLEEIQHLDCADGTRMYFYFPGPLLKYKTLERVYYWIYFALGIVLPLVALIFCNAHLIRALRRSTRMRAESRTGRGGSTAAGGGGAGGGGGGAGHNSGQAAANRITLTLVVIVIMYIVLFVPGEMMNFFKDVAVSSLDAVAVYNLTYAVLNLLQMINFAFNFVLYCAINTHFRHTICRLFCCARCRRGVGGGSGGSRRRGRSTKNTASKSGVDGRLYGSFTEASTCV